MIEDVQIEEIFDRVIVAIAGLIADLELVKVEDDHMITGDTVIETLYTTGNFDAFIMCRIEPQLYEYIVKKMHGDVSPARQDKPLYLNEFMNMICGRAVSIINNITGNASRLSVPTFYMPGEHPDVTHPAEAVRRLSYQSKEGNIDLEIHYTFYNRTEEICHRQSKGGRA